MAKSKPANSGKASGKPSSKTNSGKPAGSKAADTTAARVKPKTTKAAATQPPAKARLFYLSVRDGNVQISNAKPKGAQAAEEFSDFSAVKDRALDALLACIDRCELDLHALKRSATFEEFQGLGENP